MQINQNLKRKTKGRNTSDESVTLDWSDTFVNEEKDELIPDSSLSDEVTSTFDDTNLESATTKKHYNRNYVVIKFRELIKKLQLTSKSNKSVFLKSIDIAEFINANIEIFEQYPIERQTLAFSKLSLSKIIHKKSEKDLIFLINQLQKLVEKDMEEKAFESFKRNLIQNKLINFREVDDNE